MKVPKRWDRGRNIRYRCSTEFIIRPDGNVEINHPSVITLKIALSLNPGDANLRKMVEFNDDFIKTFGKEWSYRELFCG